VIYEPIELQIPANALNFANVFLNEKRMENKKNVTKIKNVKRFYIYDMTRGRTKELPCFCAWREARS